MGSAQVNLTGETSTEYNPPNQTQVRVRWLRSEVRDGHLELTMARVNLNRSREFLRWFQERKATRAFECEGSATKVLA